MKGKQLSTDTVTTPEAPAEDQPLVFQDELHELQFYALSKMIGKRNGLVGTLNAAQGDRVSITENYKNNSTDPNIVAARDAVAKAQEALDALIAPLVEQAITNASGNTGEVEAELKALDDKLKPGMTYFKKLFEGDPTIEALPAQDRLKSAVLGRSGSGGRRIRGFNVIVTLDGEVTEFDSFTAAAKFLEAETVQLQKAFFDAAEKPIDAPLKDLPNEVSFYATVTEVDDDDNVTEKRASVKAYRTEPVQGEANGSEESESEVAPTPAPAGEEVAVSLVAQPEEVDLENLG